MRLFQILSLGTELVDELFFCLIMKPVYMRLCGWFLTFPMHPSIHGYFLTTLCSPLILSLLKFSHFLVLLVFYSLFMSFDFFCLLSLSLHLYHWMFLFFLLFVFSSLIWLPFVFLPSSVLILPSLSFSLPSYNLFCHFFYLLSSSLFFLNKVLLYFIIVFIVVSLMLLHLFIYFLLILALPFLPLPIPLFTDIFSIYLLF